MARRGAGRRRGTGTRRARTGGSKIGFVILLALLVGGVILADRYPWPGAPLPARSGVALNDVASWGYQLQKLRTSRMARSIDLLVIDYSRDGTERRAFTAKDLQRLRNRGPDLPPRIILAYLSVGEAESYRYYWWRHWTWLKPPGLGTWLKPPGLGSWFKPGWLGDENENWQGNYPVRFWQPGWRSIIYQPERSLLDALLERVFKWKKPYLDRIMEAGFDGVYLDRVDVFDDWRDEKRGANKLMVRFVERLSRYAKARKPGFLIVPQNGEELLRFSNYRRAIDGFAKEDLFYGVEDDGEKNSRREVRRTLRYLDKAREDGLPVFVVEYLTSKKKRLAAHRRTDNRGYILHFAWRALDKAPRVIKPLPEPVPDPAETSAPANMPASLRPAPAETSPPAETRVTPEEADAREKP